MKAWSEGYVVDISYTSGYYRELAPLFLDYVCLLKGKRLPRYPEDNFAYCELGCGQGFTINLLAAANPCGRFLGVDFNSAHIVRARDLARGAGLRNITFEDRSFESLVKNADEYPVFDYVVLHGVYSWVSSECREAIIRFLELKLKPGGIVYVSYNSLPGWSSIAPLQRLILEHADRHPGQSCEQAEKGFAFANRLKNMGALFFSNNEKLHQRLETVETQDKRYLAHEYLNRNWTSLYHADVVSALEQARLDFVGSATIMENIDSVSLPADCRNSLNEFKDDPVLAETVRDFAANRQFRRDVFQRGMVTLFPNERLQATKAFCFALALPRQDATLTFKSPLGEVDADPGIYLPILDGLADKSLNFDELLKLPGLSSCPPAVVAQSIALLVGSAQVSPSLPGLPGAVSGKDVKIARAFNSTVAKQVLLGDELGYLAAPGIGSGVPVNFPEMSAYLMLEKNPKGKMPEVSDFVWKQLTSTGRSLIKDGRHLKDKNESREYLHEIMLSFFEHKLPVWRRLGMI